MKIRSPGHIATAILLGLLAILVLTVTAHDFGVTWDEPVYIEASESYMSWLAELTVDPAYALGGGGIREYWTLNHEHPPFDKAWSGLVWSAARLVFGELTAHRLGNILLVGLLTALVYLLVAPEHGRAAGLAGVGALFTMPRFFVHAHLAALDVPAAVTMFLVCFVFWRTLEHPAFKWTICLGVVFGIAIATKINGLLEIPIILVLWSLFLRRRWYVYIRLGITILIGLVAWIVTWPWLYHDTGQRLVEYFNFLIVNHYQIGQWYLWHMYSPPPWHFPFVITLVVMPATLVILCFVAAFAVFRSGRKQPLGWLIIFGALVPLIVLATGRAQVFDDDRLMLPSIPFLAALAGIGFSLLVHGIRSITWKLDRRAWTVPLTVLLVGITFVPQLAVAWTLYPHLLSYYSEAVAGLVGATRLGFENTYWSETYAVALPYLNANAPPGALVWVEAHDVMLYYQHLGLLRRDLRIGSQFGNEGIVKGTQGYKASIEDADYAVIQYRESGFSPAILNWMNSRKPLQELDYINVPLMAIYAR